MNITRDNLVVHYSFTDSTIPLKRYTGDANYTSDFSLSKLVANRTDSNQQYFEVSFSEDMDLIQVLSHKLFHHDSYDISLSPKKGLRSVAGLNADYEVDDDDSYEIGRERMNSHQDFTDLTVNP